MQINYTIYIQTLTTRRMVWFIDSLKNSQFGLPNGLEVPKLLSQHSLLLFYGSSAAQSLITVTLGNLS